MPTPADPLAERIAPGQSGRRADSAGSVELARVFTDSQRTPSGFPADQQPGRRWVLHMDMDAFFASAEQLTRPTLRGRPVLVGGMGGRGVVAGASYEARVFGARSAMPMHQARRLVGVTGVVIPPRGAVYAELSSQVFDTMRTLIPVLETLSFDEAFGEPAELAGARPDTVLEFCEQLRAAVLERTGLVASVGAGSGKQLAKIASDMAKPNGVRVISPAEQRGFLAALPVRRLWGIGPVAESRLRTLGIETVGALAALGENEVSSILGGAMGIALLRLARGIDDRPVAERAEAKQISAETTYESDIVTLAQLRPAIEAMAGSAHRRLIADGRAARTVVLKLKRSDMSIVTRSSTLPYATEELATLAAAAQRSAIDPAELGPIRLVGVGFAGLSEIRQESLFPELDQAVITDAAVSEEPTLGPAVGPDPDAVPPPASRSYTRETFYPGLDVAHPEFGHGWVQGAGHGVVTVRFETRSSGPGPAYTFPATDPQLTRADPLASLG